MPASFVSGGAAAALQTRYRGFAASKSIFISSGCMIGALSGYMQSGSDKS
jgi:hypothetical protein